MSIMSSSTRFDINPISGFMQKQGNCLTSKRTVNVENLAERDLKLIMPETAHNEFAQQIYAQYDQWFVCNCSTNTKPEKAGSGHTMWGLGQTLLIMVPRRPNTSISYTTGREYHRE